MSVLRPVLEPFFWALFLVTALEPVSRPGLTPSFDTSQVLRVCALGGRPAPVRPLLPTAPQVGCHVALLWISDDLGDRIGVPQPSWSVAA